MTLSASSSSSFLNWQPVYAAHRIPTFPVRISAADKVPMVSNYAKFGLRGSSEIAGKFPDATAFVDGNRNVSLFPYCMREALHCDNFEALLDLARTRNAEYLPPMSDARVVKIAKSAWGYTERGENRFGQRGAWLPQSNVNTLVRDPALFALVAWLKAANRPDAEFLVANGLCVPEYLNWPISLLRKARSRAIETGWIVKIRHEVKGVAALYRWGPTAKS